jgi:hypothetical protein
MRPNQLSTASSRRKLRPAIECLESRELPSANITSGQLIGKGKVQPFLDPNVITQAAAALYGPPPTAQNPNPNYPTPAEIRREEFTASAIGQYTIGPATFSDRSERIYGSGRNSASNAWLKAKWQVVLYPPADPNATPNPGDPYANQVTGVVVFITQNYLQSGTGLMLDLNANVAPGSDPRALPTHGTWTYDTNSSGAFTGPFGFTEGTGTWTARYIADAHPKAGTEGSGTVVFEFQGLYNFSQIVSGVSKYYS